MALAGACGRRSGAGFAGYALIATSGEKTISVVDLADFRLLKQVPVGGAPQAILGRGPERCYVLTPDTGSVHAVGNAFTEVMTRKLADHIGGFALTPDGKHLLAIARGTQELVEAETASLRVTNRWKLSGQPVALDVSPGGTAAISTGEGGTVELIDRKTGRQARKDLRTELGGVRFRADGKLLVAADYGGQTLTALNVPDLQVMVQLPLAMTPQNLCFNSDGGQLFVSGKGMDGIAIAFPYLPLEVEQTVLGGRDPGVMACSADPAYLFVASASGSDVSILDIGRRKMIGIVEVGQDPGFVAITPDDQYALVLNRGSGDMAVIHIASIQAKLGDAAKMRGKALASLFTMLPVGSHPVQATIIPKAV